MPTTFANTINGNEILAKRSQCDYAGNEIQTTYATKTEVTTGLAGKENTISDLATIRSGAAAGATAVQPGDLATVATTGAYSDLTGTPTIPSGVELVPAATSADADKVLTVDSQGIPGWATPSGGGGSSEIIGAFNYQDHATYENINKVIIGSKTGDAYKILVGAGSYSDDLFGYNTFSAQTGFVSGSALVWITPYGQDWSDLLSVNSIFGLGEFRTMTGTDSTQLTFGHPVPGFFKGQGRLVQFESNQERNSVIWEAQFDMPEFDNGSYTWYYNKGYTCKVTKVNGTFTSGYSLLFVIVNGEDAPDFYGQNLSYIADYILTGDYVYGYSGNNIIHASKSVTLDKVNGVPNTSGYSQGDVLTIDSNGGAVWATPSGGGSVTDVEVNGTSVVNASGVAEVTVPAQVNADWNAVSGAAEILNKPTIPAAQVNSDWNASSGVAEILNKPTILPYKPVVAGTGVRIVDDTANNRIVVEADETVLWESQDNAGHQTATLSESRANFERIKILFSTSSSSKPYGMWYEIPSDTTDFNVMRGKGGSNVWMTWIRLTFSTNTSLTVASAKSFNFGAQSATSWVNPSVSVDMSEDINSIWKVVGVNRIASN